MTDLLLSWGASMVTSSVDGFRILGKLAGSATQDTYRRLRTKCISLVAQLRLQYASEPRVEVHGAPGEAELEAVAMLVEGQANIMNSSRKLFRCASQLFLRAGKTNLPMSRIFISQSIGAVR